VSVAPPEVSVPSVSRKPLPAPTKSAIPAAISKAAAIVMLTLPLFPCSFSRTPPLGLPMKTARPADILPDEFALTVMYPLEMSVLVSVSQADIMLKLIALFKQSEVQPEGVEISCSVHPKTMARSPPWNLQGE
jgi:hypothetical protein